MGKKLKLGFSVGIPFNSKSKIPEYSTANIKLIKLIKSLSSNFDCIQIMFTKLKLKTDELEQIKSILTGYKYIYVHASYQINIGADLIPSQSELYSTGIEILLNEIEYGNKIGARAIVVHMGKNVKNKYDSSHIHNNMVKFIIELFKRLNTKKITLPIFLETPAGQGGEMCWNLEEFVEFITKFSKLYFYNQLGVCLDTCHMFQAGYDFNNNLIIKQVHKILEPIKHKIKLIHLNDSYHPMGSRIDRHEQIGKGYIQTEKLIKFIHPYKSVPMILETVGPYEEQIEILSK